MPWKTGESGNPGGLSQDQRQLNKRFLKDIRKLWHESGDDILKKAASQDPVAIVRVMAGLLPKSMHVEGEVRHTFVDALEQFSRQYAGGDRASVSGVEEEPGDIRH